MATPNPTLQQILKDIGSRANQGRVSLDWGVITEARKRKVREAAPEVGKKPDDGADLPEPPTEDKPETPKEPSEPKIDVPKPDAPKEKKPEAPAPDAGEDVDAAKEDAEKAKAKLDEAGATVSIK